MNKINYPNYLIEGMTIVELEKYLDELIHSDKKIKYIFDRHQMKYITRFFSEPLQEKGVFMNGVGLKDLFNLYYADNKMKKEILSYTQDINRYLNVVIINQYELGNIESTTGDQENNFEAILSFYESMNELDKGVIMRSFNTIHKTEFETIDSFISNLWKVVRLQTFTNHYYSLFSFEYASIIKNGQAHKEKDGIYETLQIAMYSLHLFLEEDAAQELNDSISSHLLESKFSNEEVKTKVKDWAYKIMGYRTF